MSFYPTKQAPSTKNIYECPELVPKLSYRKGTKYWRWNINILTVNCIFFNFYLNFKVKYSFFLIKHKYLQNSISATYNTQNTKHYLRMFVPTREPCIKTLEVLMVRREEGR